MMKDILDRLFEHPLVTVVTLICATAMCIAMVFGMVSCHKQDCEYRLERYKTFWQSNPK